MVRAYYLGNAEEECIEETFYHNGEEKFYEIHIQKMMDSKKQLQGCYFMIQDRTEEIDNLKKQQYMATHDTLTGLYNKEYFFVCAQTYIREHTDEELLIVCFDIKNFKMINDIYGTKVGDEVLIKFAQIIRRNVDDLVLKGRLVNDIFAILIHKEDYRQDVWDSVEQKIYISSADEMIEVPLINYIGIYEIIDPNLQVSVMCDRAKMAIATIKEDYHKRVALYDNVLRDSILHEQELIGELQNAIVNHELQMYLQPQTNCFGKVLGAEALIRWKHPKKGMIMPGDFIPLFEQNGLISDVDYYIWKQACEQLRKWKNEGRKDVYISVNISPKDFYFLDIYQVFMNLVEQYGIEPRSLRLEITETAVMLDFKRQVELIEKLRQAGFIVEMDDFGSGYSSLNMLKDIEVDVLKIDMAFLRKAQDMESE